MRRLTNRHLSAVGIFNNAKGLCVGESYTQKVGSFGQLQSVRNGLTQVLKRRKLREYFSIKTSEKELTVIITKLIDPILPTPAATTVGFNSPEDASKAYERHARKRGFLIGREELEAGSISEAEYKKIIEFLNITPEEIEEWTNS